jgi:hypothetical protein
MHAIHHQKTFLLMRQEECFPGARDNDMLSWLKPFNEIAQEEQYVRYQYHPEFIIRKKWDLYKVS